MRKDWIDRWRGILMICIVAFHVMGAIAFYCNVEANTAIAFCKNKLAMFHTKGFFVLSGILWRSGLLFADFAIRKAKRLLVPYFVFGLAWALLFVFLYRYFPCFNSSEMVFWKPFISVLLANGWPDGIGFRVINALWFLPCLFLVEICYYWIDRFIPKTDYQIVLLPVCFALDRLISKPDIFWSLNLVPRFLLFFILGRVFLKMDSCRNIKNIPKFVMLVFLMAASCYVPIVTKLSSFAGVSQWSDVIRSFCGVLASMLVAQLISLKFLAVVGKYTIGILVTHKAFILILQLVKIRIEHPVTALLIACAWSLVVCIISLIAARILQRYCKWTLGEYI